MRALRLLNERADQRAAYWRCTVCDEAFGSSHEYRSECFYQCLGPSSTPLIARVDAGCRTFVFICWTSQSQQSQYRMQSPFFMAWHSSPRASSYVS